MLVIEDTIPWGKKSQVDYPGYRPEKESSKGEKSAVPEGNYIKTDLLFRL
ncbi:MAG TPA: hypothetical protein PLU94_00205 [Methanoregulaceae archaeon]|nr:hypothetical protein [Methanoregulaceae archaeon]HPM61188.1 hypothetical protein [Methanoregulaceae archaeon]